MDVFWGFFFQPLDISLQSLLYLLREISLSYLEDKMLSQLLP